LQIANWIIHANIGGGDNMAARKWALKGYRPEGSAIVAELRCRRSEPVRRGNTIDREIRLCALYVSQPEMSLRALASISRMRLGNVKEILRGWGVDLNARDLLPWRADKEEEKVCIDTPRESGDAV
jgi:hypothetical protein